MRRLVLLLLLAAIPGLAAESEPARSPRATVSLVADAAAIAPDAPFRAALRLRLAPGWHTYWRNPGDAGAAATLDLALPAGASAGPIDWPAPERLPFGPLVNFGYRGEVLLPVVVRPPPGLVPGDRVAFTAAASWLVCADICVPEAGEFTLTLPVAGETQADPRLALAFAANAAALERPAPAPVRAMVAGSRLTLGLGDARWSAPDGATFFPDAAGVVDNAAPQRWRDGRLEVVLSGPAPATATGIIVVEAGGGRTAYALSAPVEAAPAGVGLLAALGLAFLGGLLLNLMPCVFPILAMKAMALARLGGAERRAVRAAAASYTAGVLATALALGGVLIGLRAAGGAAGWGFQLTEPVFVAVLAWLLLAVGLNLSGVFRVGGPVGAGGALVTRGGHAGSFATGALAVLVATPCTAPFMATALGAALALPPAAGLAVFAALGAGLAAPYAALGVAPRLAAALPRPGAWMERLRQALAFPMYGAAAWLLWVLAQQAGPAGLGVALAGAVLVGFAAWLGGVAQAGRQGRPWRAAAVGAAVLAVGLLPAIGVAPTPRAADDRVETWSPARVAALQQAGRPVFVNLTAAWCLTCIVNERGVLASDAAAAAFAAAGAVRLTGDWTRGDPAIGALLRSLGREGVPVYLLYPAGGGPPLELPQLLTGAVLREALAGAGRAPLALR